MPEKCGPQTSETKVEQLRVAVGMIRQDRARSEAIRQQCGMKPVLGKLEEKPLTWLGHTVRMPDERKVKCTQKMGIDRKRSLGRPARWGRFCPGEALIGGRLKDQLVTQGLGDVCWVKYLNTVRYKRLRWSLIINHNDVTAKCFAFKTPFLILGVQISSCGFARDGVTTVSFHRSVFISMRWKAVISRY